MATKRKPKSSRVLVLRTCASDMTSHEGQFRWTKSGVVEAPDWSPEPRCGNGLHGFLWGEGDGSLANWAANAKWLVVSVDPADGLVDLTGKVKFRRGEVVFCGSREDATAYLAANGAAGRAIVGGTATAGYGGTATAGYGGTATAGYAGTATAGYAGTATAGDGGTATAGYAGTATAGDGGTATAGDGGTATAGDGGTATAGYAGTATAGYGGTATAGDDGIIQIRWWDGNRYRIVTGYVNENGIEPNVSYRCNAGKLVPAVKEGA